MTLATAVVLYLLLLLAMFLFQRNLIYPVPPTADIPQGFALVEYASADGVPLKAAWHAPAEGLPTVVYFHGNAGSWYSGSLATEALVAAGYGVLLPEYRGYAGIPGSPDEAGLYRDGRAALDWLAAQGVAPDRLALIGTSLGSGVASQLALERSPTALVLISGFTTLPAVGADKYPWLPVNLLMLDRFDNIAKIAQIGAPVLVLHDKTDELIPFAYGQALADTAPQGELMAFSGYGHRLAYKDDAEQAVLGWLKARQFRAVES